MRANYRSARSQDIYRFIVQFCKQHRGLPPTVREIADALDIPSTSSVRYCLDRLADQKRIEYAGHLARNIIVIGASWNAPAGSD